MFDDFKVKENTVGLHVGDYKSETMNSNYENYLIEGNRISVIPEVEGSTHELGIDALEVNKGTYSGSDINLHTNLTIGRREWWVEYNINIKNNEITRASLWGTVTFDRDALEYTMDDLSVNVIPKCYRDITLTEEAKQYSVYQVDGAEHYTLIFTNLNNPSVDLLMNEDLTFIGIINDYDPTDLPLAVW